MAIQKTRASALQFRHKSGKNMNDSKDFCGRYF